MSPKTSGAARGRPRRVGYRFTTTMSSTSWSISCRPQPTLLN